MNFYDASILGRSSQVRRSTPKSDNGEAFAFVYASTCDNLLMHVLIVPSWYPRFPGDVRGSFFREQALALKKSGCDVGVIAPQLFSLKQCKSIFNNGFYGYRFELDEGINTFRYHGLNWWPRLPQLQARSWLRLGLELFQQYEKQYGRPDIIHAHSMLNGGLLAYQIQKIYYVPYIVTEHSTAYARGLVPEKQRNVIRAISHNAERRFAVSSPFAKLLAEYVANGDAWDVMPNIVSDRFFNHYVKSEIAKSGYTFLNVCLLTEKKRVDLLIKAFAESFKGRLDIKLHIGGDGDQRKMLEGLVEKLGVKRQVEFLGMLEREKVVAHMAAADAFVLGSKYETFGVVIIEALAMGKPVIATRCGGPEDIVRKQDGILVPTDSVADMANAMQLLYQNRENFSSAEIRESCKKRYGERALAANLIRVYKEVTNSIDKSTLGSL